MGGGGGGGGGSSGPLFLTSAGAIGVGISAWSSKMFRPVPSYFVSSLARSQSNRKDGSIECARTGFFVFEDVVRDAGTNVVSEAVLVCGVGVSLLWEL